jgi:hypothetical protein
VRLDEVLRADARCQPVETALNILLCRKAKLCGNNSSVKSAT